mmetsp:Transcript_77944/g.121612  ORF Transcript_77944/g.121612 Transcript_77944/m.121612 type:complete len:302 (+) Transcript_77944:969-1874(+)
MQASSCPGTVLIIIALGCGICCASNEAASVTSSAKAVANDPSGACSTRQPMPFGIDPEVCIRKPEEVMPCNGTPGRNSAKHACTSSMSRSQVQPAKASTGLVMSFIAIVTASATASRVISSVENPTPEETPTCTGFFTWRRYCFPDGNSSITKSSNFARASSVDTLGATMQRSPGLQSAGVARLLSLVSIKESSTRRTSSKLRPVVAGYKMASFTFLVWSITIKARAGKAMPFEFISSGSIMPNVLAMLRFGSAMIGKDNIPSDFARFSRCKISVVQAKCESTGSHDNPMSCAPRASNSGP